MKSNSDSFDTIGVVGLGLIGGSIAKTVRANTDCRILAYDRAPEVMERARGENAFDDVLNESNICECDILFIALYPKATVEWLRRNGCAVGKNTVVIDCCGIKRYMSEKLEKIAREYGFVYVGGHPMAGRAKVGFEASCNGMFDGASMILTEAPEKLRLPLERFFQKLGFKNVKWTTADEHDRIIAYTSQLAHVLSNAYVKSPAALEHDGFSAGSFLDLTRVAWLNEDMWTELFIENGDYLASEIECLSARLMEYAKAIRKNDEFSLKGLLKEGRERKEYIEGRK